MSTERRRSAGGRRRATGPADDARGNGGRRRATGPAGDERAAGRRRAREDDSGGFWDDERPPRRRSEGTRSRGDRPNRARSEGAREGGRRRPPERDGGRRSSTHGTRAEGGTRRAADGRRRPPSRDRDEEYDDRGPVKRFFAKVWKPTLAVCGLMFVAGVAVLGIAYAKTPDPRTMDQQDAATLSATSISYADGKEAVTTGEINRVMVERDQIPDTVINGVLGSEQRNFYEEPGISISGTMRAVLSGGSAGGGSTITQQMARNYYAGLSQERSYVRKFNEILISIKAGQLMEPDEILEKYLNTIYFGRNAYGVQAAAQAYFDKNVEDLDAAEGAFIGAIIQQPGNFENVEEGSKMAEILHERWEYARDGMVVMHEENPDYGISQEEADKLEFPEVQEYAPGENLDGYKGYIMTAVRAELEERYGLDAGQISTRGYQVETSLDKELMDAADSAFEETLGEMPEETVFGLAAVDPKTGEIKAFHGGDDFTSDPNNSIDTDAQAGSAFKPYVLATGLEQGIGLRSVFDGSSPQEFEGVEDPIQNDSNRDWGDVNLVQSTAHSVNTSFVQLAIETTPSAVVDTAEASGIPEARFESAAMGPNIALGTYRVTALDQASGFSTFANDGVHMPQHMVTKVVDANGDELVPKDADKLESGTRAFSSETAADATYAMTQVVEDGGGETAALPDGRPVAGKTGTSNSAKSAWFVGFTPQLSTAVGLSRTDGEQLVIPSAEGDVYGGTSSAKVWRTFMTKAMEGQDPQSFRDPVWKGDELNYLPSPEPSDGPTEEASPEPDDEPSAEESEEPEASPDPSWSPPEMSPDPGGDCEFPYTDCEPEGPGGPDDPGGPDIFPGRDD